MANSFGLYWSSGNNSWNWVDSGQCLPDGARLATALETTYREGDDEAAALYRGPFYMDFDAEDLYCAISDVKAYLLALRDEFSVPLDTLEIYCTGGRGFHVLVPAGTFMDRPDQGLPSLPAIYHEMAYALVQNSTDMRIYNGKRGRMLRLPNVQRENGFYKVPITAEEALAMDQEMYSALTQAPREMPPPAAPVFSPKLALLFVQCKDKAGATLQAKRKRVEARRRQDAASEGVPRELHEKRLQSALAYLVEHRAEQFGDYQEWLAVMMALHLADHYELAKRFSQSVPGWKGEADFDRAWDGISDGGGDLITIATIFFKAREAGWEDEETKADVKLQLAQMLEQGKTDKGVLVSPAFVELLRYVFRYDKPEYVRIMSHRVMDGVKQVIKGELKAWVSGDAPATATHLDIAHRSLEILGGASRMIFTNGSFYKWMGNCWRPVEESQEVKRAIHQAFDGAPFKGSCVVSVLDLMRTEAYVQGVQFDRAAESRIAFLNGELHWNGQGWELQPHNPGSYLTSVVPWPYTEGAQCPLFMKWCEDVFRDDADREAKTQLLLEFIGYSLTSSTRFQKFLILYGTSSNNGKSTALLLVKAILGERNIAHVRLSELGDKFKTGLLRGKLANLVAEVSAGEQLPDAILKMLVSGDPVTVELKGQNGFEFTPYAKLWIGCNHRPTTRDFSPAVVEKRAEFLTFNRRFIPGQDDDMLILSQLVTETPGIICAALDAYAAALTRGQMTVVPSSQVVKSEWKGDIDLVSQWFEDECSLCSHTMWVTVSDALKAFRQWCDQYGYRGKDFSATGLWNRLKLMGITKGREYEPVDGKIRRCRVYYGMCIGDPPAPPEAKPKPEKHNMGSALRPIYVEPSDDIPF